MRKGAPEGKPQAADGDKDKGVSHGSDPAVCLRMHVLMLSNQEPLIPRGSL